MNKADYIASLFKAVEGAISDLRRAAPEWSSLGYFDQDDLLNGIADAGRCLAGLEGAPEDGNLTDMDQRRLSVLRAEYARIQVLAQDLENRMKSPPAREEYEAMVAAEGEKNAAA